MKADPFVSWFRQSSPYIHSHRGRTFVVGFGGEACSDPQFPHLIHDLALLHALGIRLVLVAGARPQIEQRLKSRGAEVHYVEALRVTDPVALACVKEAAGVIRVEIEALLSMGLTNSPMAGARIRVASGNFVTARPIGVLNGVDYQHTGEVRRIDTEAIHQRLDDGAVVLMTPIGYSPTGEVFNLSASEVATRTAITLGADKLIWLLEGPGVLEAEGRLITHLTPRQVDDLLAASPLLTEEITQSLQGAVDACRRGVKRIHLISRRTDGALLRELFTRDGIGTLITAEPFEDMRPARIDDVGGILELIAPLEASGFLVRRSRERLEMEIGRFLVMERDGMIIACAALYPYPGTALGELAALAVHPDYRSGGRGDKLLEGIETQARSQGVERLFVLTTQTAHWFQERGFEPAGLTELPIEKQALYNYRRNSKVFIKPL